MLGRWGFDRRLAPYVFAAPAVLIMAVGLFYPVVEAVRLSLYEVRLGEPPTPQAFRGLSILAEALADSSVRTSMAVTLQFSVLVVAVEMVLGVALALALEKPLRGMRAFRTLFVLPMMIAPICVGLIWRYMFDVNVGPINSWLAMFHVKPAWLADPSLAFFTLCVTDIWQFTPFVFILALAGLQGIDQSAVEAAKIDGASVLQTIRYIKIPLLAPILMITILMRLIDALRGLEVVYAMTNGGPGLSTELFSLHIYKSAFVTQRMGHSAALSVCLLVVTTALSAALLMWSNPMRRKGG
ncbi:sugar ABC transporter permease [Bradyrhizobium prioriisuperbiae]|uniref:carbohydrate ABC transporter permease n=1 Tax=Bradyrhizobium prioriisuperbiae TaxID=2854389 RepID=UPI0028EF56D9|nr:sugar ABC transporter permease [Bradyrhizobium prioritasuperba]